mgnify:CR=1 FL=1
MKNPSSIICLLIGALVLTAACEKKEKTPDLVYFLIGATSMGYEESVVGEASSFAVGGPDEADSYGRVVILADGKEKASSGWGGSSSLIGSISNPPQKIELKGNSDRALYFGIMRLNPITGKSLLLEKGTVQRGAIDVVVSWDEGAQTYTTSGK